MSEVQVAVLHENLVHMEQFGVPISCCNGVCTGFAAAACQLVYYSNPRTLKPPTIGLPIVWA